MRSAIESGALAQIHPMHTLSCERTNVTYYNHVRIADRYRVGEVNGGWQVIGYALEIEHGTGLVAGTQCKHLRDLAAKALSWLGTAQREGRPALADPRERVAMHAEMSFLLGRRALWNSAVGRPDPGKVR